MSEFITIGEIQLIPGPEGPAGPNTVPTATVLAPYLKSADAASTYLAKADADARTTSVIDAMGFPAKFEANARGLIGNAIAFFGDSITDYGEGYARYAEILSNGLITPSIHSNPGFTSTALKDVLAAQVVARSPKPTACLILCGANDAQAQTGLATYKANVTAMVQMLRDAGIVPILGTVTPNLNETYDKWVRLYNAWIMRFGELSRIPVVDFYTKVKNPVANGWAASTPDSDGLHPATAANKALGQAVVSTLSPIIIPRQYLVQSFAGSPNMLANSNFATDTNSDGIADGLSASPASGFAYSRVFDSRGFYWQRMTLSGGGTVQRRFQAAQLTPGTWKVGDRLRVASRIRTGQDQVGSGSTPQAPIGAQVQITCYKAGYAGVTLNVPLLGLGLSRALDGIVAREFVIPASTEIIVTEFIGGPSDGTYDFAQPTVLNLTAAEIA